jgi:hypothetical protein
VRRGNRDPREAGLDCETGRRLIRDGCSLLAGSDKDTPAHSLILLPASSPILP